MGNEEGSLRERDLMGLTEEELYCVAKHIQIHVVKGIFHDEGEFRERFAPCENCRHIGAEKPCKFSGYPSAVFEKLGKMTDLRIFATLIGFKI